MSTDNQSSQSQTRNLLQQLSDILGSDETEHGKLMFFIARMLLSMQEIQSTLAVMAHAIQTNSEQNGKILDAFNSIYEDEKLQQKINQIGL